MKKSIKHLIITLGILTALGGIHLGLTPYLLSSTFVINQIQSNILNNYGFNVTLDKFKIRTCITPHIKIKAKEIILNNEQAENTLKIQNLDTKINVFNLLFKTLNITKLDVDNANLSLKTDYSEKIFSPKVINIIKHTTLKNTNIRNLTINLENQKLIEDIQISSSDIIISKFNTHKKIKTNLSIFMKDKNNAGSLKANMNLKLPLTTQNIQKSSANINIENLNLNTFSKAINKLSQNIESVNGTINLNIQKDSAEFFTLNLLSKNFRLKYLNNDFPIYHTKPIELKTIISTTKEKITINSLKIASELIKASSFGSINIEDTKNPDLNLTVSLDKSNIQELIKLLPSDKNLINELNLQALKKSNLNGEALAHIDITGKIIQPLINGNILLKEVFLNQPIKNTKKATIKLIFNRNKMFLETTVPTAPKERISANGTFELYDEKRCELNINTTQKINLETAQSILNPLQEIIKIDFGPLPIMKIKGYGNAQLKIHGNQLEPHISGDFNFNNAQISFNDIPNLKLKNSAGNLHFSDTKAYFKTTEAFLNSSTISINGDCDFFGKFNFTVNTPKQNLNNFISNIKENTILNNINTYLEQIENIKGFGDITLNLYGEIKNLKEIELNKNLFAKGTINLNAVTLKLKTIPQAISNIFGELAIENQDLIINLYALLNKSKITIDGKIKETQANLIIKTKDFRIIDGIATLPLEQQRNVLTLIHSKEFINLLPSINTNFTARYKGSFAPLDAQNIEAYGTLYSTTNNSFKKSTYDLVNSTLKYTPIKFYGNDIKLDTVGTISEIFSATPTFNGEFNLKDFNLALINIPTLKSIEQVKPFTNQLKKLEGKINLSSQIINNNINSNIDLNNIKLYGEKYTHEIINGKIQLKNNTINTNGINARIFDMPILMNGKISLLNNGDKSYNLSINAKPNQDFINTCYNQKALYPIKIKGDLTLNAEITGNQKHALIKSDLLLAKDSSIYYMGATLGDKSNAVNLSSNITLKENGIKINHFNYDKIVASLDNNKTIVPLLNINGTMNYAPNNIIKFDNLKIKSKMPVDAKIFNIIFRKPFVKQGIFTSDLTLNGTSLKPNFLGKLNITDINIPLVETNINNINFDFTPRYIYLTSKGDLLTNQTKLSATLKNNLTLPLHVENMNIHVAQLDVNKINQKIRHIEENNFKIHSTQNTSQPLDYTNFIIHNSTVTADTILIKDIIANNYSSNLEINSDKILKIKTFNFDMAEGNVNGSITHNYQNNNININLNLNQANSEQIAKSLFNIKGQIYGLANGKVTLSCNAQSDKTCLATLSGNGNFEIQNGRMPKLGSLEYLLKASNLVNNGLTGLTISGLIDLLSPLKSGEFKTINGNFQINNGIAENINIYSNGRDLNMYITGKYNLTNEIADFQIFGSLSKNVTTVFNKVKNISLNTLLKTIPGVKASSDSTFNTEISQIPNSNDINNIYKFFRVIINGDLNGENFVQSFEWIE